MPAKFVIWFKGTGSLGGQERFSYCHVPNIRLGWLSDRAVQDAEYVTECLGDARR